jgi:hypothetical protein
VPGTFTNTAEVINSDQADPDSSPGNNDSTEDDQQSISINVTAASTIENQISLLIDRLDELVQSGQISKHTGKLLTILLQTSLKLHLKGDIHATIATLRVFRLLVYRLIPNTAGKELIDAVDKIISQLMTKPIASQKKAPQFTNNDNEHSIFTLYPNTPNPFNLGTVISFQLRKQNRVQLMIYDDHGKLITRLHDKVLPVGIHRITWQPNNLPSGVYIFLLKVGPVISSSGRMLYIR